MIMLFSMLAHVLGIVFSKSMVMQALALTIGQACKIILYMKVFEFLHCGIENYYFYYVFIYKIKKILILFYNSNLKNASI